MARRKRRKPDRAPGPRTPRVLPGWLKGLQPPPAAPDLPRGPGRRVAGVSARRGRKIRWLGD
jgi:hypothetical protein